MIVQSVSTPVVRRASVEIPPESEVTREGDCYHYEAPGYHYQVCRHNPLREGLTAAAVVGVPAGLGAAESALLGTAGSAAVNVLVSPAAGAVLGGVAAGVSAYRASGKNPLYAGLAAVVGAGVGAVAFPLLKLPGTFGGPIGALVAAGAVGAGVALWQAHQNSELDRQARDHGFAG